MCVCVCLLLCTETDRDEVVYLAASVLEGLVGLLQLLGLVCTLMGTNRAMRVYMSSAARCAMLSSSPGAPSLLAFERGEGVNGLLVDAAKCAQCLCV